VTPLATWASQLRTLQNTIQARIDLPAHEGETLPFPRALHPKLVETLQAQGISSLFRHQEEAVRVGLAGKDFAVVTGTSSGKTLCFNLPVLDLLSKEPLARAIYIYPTKALAQDQLRKLENLADPLGISVGVYDGDTPKSQRAAIRRNAQIIFTTPDMLHISILPSHEVWAKSFRALRAVVIDELHVYNGIFGGHMGWVMRRLLRICKQHGSRPQVIAATATLGNAAEHFHRITSRQGHLIDKDTSPRGAKSIFLCGWPEESTVEPSPNLWAGAITAECIENGTKAITFCRSRVGTELVLRQTRSALTPEFQDSVESYRGGYSASDRAKIEKRLFSGRLTAIVATSAMELGVDVGNLPVAILNGFPPQLSSFWQQLGRSGRGGTDGVGIVLAHDNPREQFYVREPEVLQAGRGDRVWSALENEVIVRRQLLCATHEIPLPLEEAALLTSNSGAVAKAMVEAGELHEQRERYFYPSYEAPATAFGLRGVGGKDVRLMVGEEILETLEPWRAQQYAHEGAAYLHRGETFRVNHLDLESGVAIAEKIDLDYYTVPLVQGNVSLRPAISEAALSIGVVSLRPLKVTTTVMGYQVRPLHGSAMAGQHTLDCPPMHFDTIGVHVDLPVDLDGDMEELTLNLHSAEHALRTAASILTSCGDSDIGSCWYSVFPDTMQAALFFYDSAEGGLGLCSSVFADWEEWRTTAIRLLEGCSCADGCPKCLYTSWCESRNEMLSKRAGLELLHRLELLGPN